MFYPGMSIGRRGYSAGLNTLSSSTSTCSRHTRVSMSPIAEDEQFAATVALPVSPASLLSSPSSTVSLPIPERSPRRPLSASRALTPNSGGSSSGSGSGIALGIAPGFAPPHFSLPHSRESSVVAPRSPMPNSGSSLNGSRSSTGAALGILTEERGREAEDGEEEDEEAEEVETAEEDYMDEKSAGLEGLRERQWHERRWVRYGLFALVGLLLAGLIVGLAVGLTVGKKLRKAEAALLEQNEPAAPFPAGSYTIETTLSKPATACTSNPLTWSCYPYVPSSNATFFWTIRPSADESTFSHATDLAISSLDNPFAPSFRNLTLTRHDRGQPSERLTFSFEMNKTVIAAGPVTSNRTSARCTYSGTKFRATLWPRRKNGVEIDEASGDEANDDDKDYRTWPGDVEVEMIKAADGGQPECESFAGNKIDVPAGTGLCTCQYANFAGL